jgi:hypothetical protein
MMPPVTAFICDTLYVVFRFLGVLWLWLIDGGFERKEFYILRGDQRTLVVWRTCDGPPPTMPKRLKPWKIVLPGWSYFTRLPHYREEEVRYKWL